MEKQVAYVQLSGMLVITTARQMKNYELNNINALPNLVQRDQCKILFPGHMIPDHDTEFIPLGRINFW